MMELTAKNVSAVFDDCLFRWDEDHTDFVAGDAVMMRVGFHPDRLESHKGDVGSMLSQLSDDFREGRGGGMTFLNACMTRAGVQWGEHANIDQLIALGTATGQAIIAPREMWSLLPGGMPYFSVKL